MVTSRREGKRTRLVTGGGGTLVRSQEHGYQAGNSLASHTLRKRRKGLVPYGRRFCSVGMQLLI